MLERSVYSESNYAHRVRMERIEFLANREIPLRSGAETGTVRSASDPVRLRTLRPPLELLPIPSTRNSLTFSKRPAVSKPSRRSWILRRRKSCGRWAIWLPIARERIVTRKRRSIRKIRSKFRTGSTGRLVDFEEDRYDEGIAGLRELLRLEPDMSGVYMELGRALVP